MRNRMIGRINEVKINHAKFLNQVDEAKPWKDPESLFCDTEFLTTLIGKEPTKGKECKDKKKI